MPESILVTTNRSASSVQVLFADEVLCILYPFCNKHSLVVFFLAYDIMSVQQRAGTEIMFCFFPSDWLWCPRSFQVIGSHGHMVAWSMQVSGRIVARMGDVTLASWTVHQPIFGIVGRLDAAHPTTDGVCCFSTDGRSPLATVFLAPELGKNVVTWSGNREPLSCR